MTQTVQHLGLRFIGNAFPVQLPAGLDPHFQQSSLTGFWPCVIPFALPRTVLAPWAALAGVFIAPGGLEGALSGLRKREVPKARTFSGRIYGVLPTSPLTAFRGPTLI